MLLYYCKNIDIQINFTKIIFMFIYYIKIILT